MKIFFLLASCIIFIYHATSAMDSLHKGIPVDQLYAEVSALVSAVHHSQLAVVQLLLSRGANVHQQDKGGKTALNHVDLKNPQATAIIKALLDAGADVNHRPSGINCDHGQKPLLYHAINHENSSVVDLLLEHHASVNERYKFMKSNHDCWAPLHLAVEIGNLEIVQILLQHGANCNFTVNYNNQKNYTPLKIAIAKIDFASRFQSSLSENKYRMIKKILNQWPLSEGCKASRLAFYVAMHERCGKKSPARLCPQEIFQKICSYVNPYLLKHNHQARATYTELYDKCHQQSSVCTIL